MNERQTTLNVYLRGTRDYVQGSQILGQTAIWLTKTKDTASLLLTSVKFLKVSDRVITAIIDLDDKNTNKYEDKIIGVAWYVGQNKQSLTVHFVESSTDKAPHIKDSPSLFTKKIDTARLEGKGDYHIDVQQESFLAATIELTKFLHSKLGNDVIDIWFTSLASAHLPVTPHYVTKGSIIVDSSMERQHEGQLLTLCQVTDSNMEQSFIIGFTCKFSGEDSE